MTGRIAGPLWERFLLRSGPPAPPTDGTLSEPMAEGTGRHGSWGGGAPAGGGVSLAGLALMAALPIGLAVLGLAAAGHVLNDAGGERRERRRPPFVS